MKKFNSGFTILLVLCFVFIAFSSDAAITDTSVLRARAVFPNGVKFTENVGQIVGVDGNPQSHVFYKASAPGLELFVTSSGITYRFITKKKNEGQKDAHGRRHHEWNIVDLSLEGADIRKERINAENQLRGQFNFFLPHQPEGLYGARQYDRLVIKDIYPGIDWVLYNSSEKGFKYDFVVRPGGDPAIIRMEYTSLWPAELTASGDIELSTPLGRLHEGAPYSYLEESHEMVPSGFKLVSVKKQGELFRSTLALKLDHWKNNLSTLVIDPLLTWSTFFGGSYIDGAMSLKTDQTGNVFIAGYTAGVDLPLKNSGTYYQGSSISSAYQFIVKFSPAGVLLWSTLYGGIAGVGFGQVPNHGTWIDTDKNGNVFMCGVSSATNFPTFNNNTYFQPVLSGVTDMTIVKFDNLGNRLWATYYGGSSVEETRNICVDTTGNLFIVGTSQSSNTPVMNAGTYYQSTSTLTTPGFIARFSNNGALSWATYFDGLSPFACTVDDNNNFYVTGSGSQPAMPLLNPGGGAYFQGTSSGLDVAVLKFTNGGALQWSTLFGGNNIDQARSATVDRFGNLFIAGWTTSTNFPFLNSGGFFQNTLGSTGPTTGDAFISKFGPQGTLLWSTLYGGNNLEAFSSYNNLCTDTCGRVYLAFETKSSNMFVKAACEGGFIDSVFDGTGSNPASDIFITRFDNIGHLEWATYLGGNGSDFRSSVDVDASGQLYVTGEWVLASQTNNYPVVSSGSMSHTDGTNNGQDDSFIARFSMVPAGLSLMYDSPVCQGSGAVSFTTANLPPGGTFSAAPGLSLNASTGLVDAINSVPGTYTVTYAKNYSLCLCPSVQMSTATAVTSATIVIQPSSQLSITGASSVCAGQPVVQSVAGGVTYTWSTGSNSQTVSVAPLTTMVYSVQATDNSGCISSATKTITVWPVPLVTVSGADSICLGAAATQSAAGASTYSWNTGAQTSSIIVSPVATTIYTVVGISQHGCSSQATKTVLVLPLPSIQIAGDDTACEGDSLQLVAGGAQTYSWSTGDIGNILNILPATSSVYTVTGTSLHGCTASSTIAVTVFTVPVLQLAGTKTVCPGGAAHFTVSGASGYTWSGGAQTNTVVFYPQSTTVFSVSGSGASGCQSVLFFTVEVSECTAIAEFEGKYPVRIFPNPNSGSFVVEGTAGSQLVLINDLGQVIREIELDNQNNHRAEVDGLPAGTYFLRPRGQDKGGYRIIVGR